MKRIIQIATWKWMVINAIFLSAITATGQQRIVLNNGAGLVINGGTNTVPSYLVVDNSNANAITRDSGNIYSENEFNMVKWNISNSTGNYVVPFGYSPTTYLPVTMQIISNPGSSGGSIKFSTYHTTALNSATEPSGVTNLTPFILPGSPSNSDNSYNIVDRFYIIDANTGYTSKPAADNITFSYISGGANTEAGTPNTLTENRLIAERFNSTTNNWSDWAGYGCTDAVSNNRGMVSTGPVSAANLFRSWSLWDNTMALPVKITSGNSSCSSLGSATANVFGGKAQFTYSWSPSGGTNSTATGLSAGVYTVTVTDANGCIGTASATITQGKPVVVKWWSIYNVTCYGSNTGKAISNVYGGSTPYTYSWSNGNTTGTASGLSAGSYTLTVTDINECSATNTVTITQPASALTETITLNSNLTCHALAPLNNPNGSATANPSGGTAPYTFSWFPAGGKLQTSVTLPAGNDNCLLTDNRGCTTTATITLTQPSVIFALFTKTIPLCNGNNNGTIKASGTGGSGIYTAYTWAPYGGNLATAVGLSAQTYTVTITDNTGCLGTAPTVLGQPATVAVTIPTFTCVVGGKGTVVANATGGTAAYHYSWSNGTSTVGALKTETLPNGSYTVTVTDSHNCPAAQASTFISGCPQIIGREEMDNNNGKDSGLNDIAVYPNPTTGQFTITGLEANMIIGIYDYTGKKLNAAIRIINNQSTINLSSEPNGIYLIRIVDRRGALAGLKKVVKTN